MKIELSSDGRCVSITDSAQKLLMHAPLTAVLRARLQARVGYFRAEFVNDTLEIHDRVMSASG